MKYEIRLINKHGQIIRHVETDCKRDECQRIGQYLLKEVCSAADFEVVKIKE